MTDTVAEIAGRLTKAQRGSLLAMPANATFKPRVYVRITATWACLKAARLIRSTNGAYGVDAVSLVTPLGLAVREHLLKEALQ